MSILILYLISILDNVQIFLEISSTITLFIGLLLFLLSILAEDKINKYCIIAISIGIALSFFNVFIPDTKTMYVLYGTKILQDSGMTQQAKNIISEKIEQYYNQIQKENFKSIEKINK